jgi:uncharacterized protein
MRFTAKTASLALLLAAIAAASPVLADDTPKRTISLSATGAIKTPPDKVDISTGVTSQAVTARQALAKNTEAMSQVVAALKADGIDPKDIQTSNFSVSPLYEDREENRSPKIIGYQVTNSVRITVHDIGKLGDILDKVVTLGANDVGAIDFGIDEPEALKDKARQLAMANAIANAKLYAEAAGVKLGKILTINEDQGVVVARYAPPAPAMEMAKAVPIEAGTATVEVRVHVSFELE